MYLPSDTSILQTLSRARQAAIRNLESREFWCQFAASRRGASRMGSMTLSTLTDNACAVSIAMRKLSEMPLKPTKWPVKSTFGAFECGFQSQILQVSVSLSVA